MSPPAPAQDRPLPAGVVTFMMTDVEGSGKHWTAHSEEMATSLRHLDVWVADIVTKYDGSILKARGEGDSHFAVFDRPTRAVLAACALQTQLRKTVGSLDLRVRMAVHSGEVDPVEDDYFGVPVNQTARLRSLAHGGQTLVSRVIASHVEVILAGQVRLKSLGYHKVQDFPRLEEVFQAALLGGDEGFPPLRTEATRGPAVMTVVLVDICGASDLVRDRGGEQLEDEQRRWISCMRRLGEAHGSAALKILGDGCLVAFEDPAEGLAFARSTRTALADSDLQIRSGVAAGRVELLDGDVIGTATFVAAELMRIARPGQIVLTGGFLELAGVQAEASSLGSRTRGATGHSSELFAL